jgi:hypothetical protein
MLGTRARRINLRKAELLLLTRFFMKKELLPAEPTAGKAIKALLVRFETKAGNWLALHYVALGVFFFEKSTTKIKLKQLLL